MAESGEPTAPAPLVQGDVLDAVTTGNSGVRALPDLRIQSLYITLPPVSSSVGRGTSGAGTNARTSSPPATEVMWRPRSVRFTRAPVKLSLIARRAIKAKP